MNLAFVWQKEWTFFFPAEFHFGSVANWYCVSITELWSELQRSCSVAVSKLRLLEFFKRPCADQHLVLICLEASVQDRTWVFRAYEAQHSSLSPYFPHSFTFQKNPERLAVLSQWQEHLLHTSCFVYKEPIEAESKSLSIFHMQWVKLLANSTVPHQVNPCSSKV